MKTFQKPLTSKEEAEYLRLLQDGDSRQAKEAKSVLVERNLRLVAHVARKYQNTGEEMEDLIKIMGGKRVYISAQCQAQPFYQRLGYTAYGEVYLDEHCPHIDMEKYL